jgi:hypothetical protein
MLEAEMGDQVPSVKGLFSFPPRATCLASYDL